MLMIGFGVGLLNMFECIGLLSVLSLMLMFVMLCSVVVSVGMLMVKLLVLMMRIVLVCSSLMFLGMNVLSLLVFCFLEFL